MKTIADKPTPGSAKLAPPIKAERERRHIYGGDPQSKTPGYVMSPNRRAIRRRRSTFNIVLALFALGVCMVFYISNILAVNRIAAEVHELQMNHDKIQHSNQQLRAEIDRKSAWERINVTASRELSLRPPGEQPLWFSIDEEKVQQLREQEMQQAR